MNIFNPRLVHQIFRGSWVALLVIIACLFVYFAMPILSPFLFAWLLAYLLNPIVTFLNRKLKFPRWLASLCTLIVFVALALVLITFIVANVIIEITQLFHYIQSNFSAWINHIDSLIHSSYLQNIYKNLSNFYSENPNLQDAIDSNIKWASDNLTQMSKVVFSSLIVNTLNFIVSLPGLLAYIIFFLLATYFISKDWFKIGEKMKSWTSPAILELSYVIRNDLGKALFGYIRAQLVMISLTALFVIIGLIIIGVNYAVILGLIVGLVDLMPYLGVGAFMIPWILTAFLFQGDIYLGVSLSILYGVVFVIRQIIEPKIVATSIGMNPLIILFAMFAGLTIFGILGLLIGPVIAVALFSFHRAQLFRRLTLYVKSGRNLESDRN